MPNLPRIDLRRGVVEPVILMISRRQVEEHDVASVVAGLKLFTATREDAWRYRGQMSLVVDGYGEDERELVDIEQVRVFLCAMELQWALLHGCPGDGLVVLPPLQTQRICRMPNKHNTKRRHHIPKMKYAVRNWREYDAALRARGSLTLWVTPEAIIFGWPCRAPRVADGASTRIWRSKPA